MAQAQAQTPFAEEPEQQAGTEQQLPETVEAVVDGGQPNGYKIVRSATGTQYVEVSACRQDTVRAGRSVTRAVS